MTSKTVAIYQETENGILRLGTFTPHNATSVRHISEQFRAKHPAMTETKLWLAKRHKQFGEWVDGERIQMD